MKEISPSLFPATGRGARFPENKQTVKANEVAARFREAKSWQAFWAAWKQAQRLGGQAQLLVIDAMKAAKVRLANLKKGGRHEEN